MSRQVTTVNYMEDRNQNWIWGSLTHRHTHSHTQEHVYIYSDPWHMHADTPCPRTRWVFASAPSSPSLSWICYIMTVKLGATKTPQTNSLTSEGKNSVLSAPEVLSDSVLSQKTLQKSCSWLWSCGGVVDKQKVCTVALSGLCFHITCFISSRSFKDRSDSHY